MKARLVFDHLPKTAGTSISAALEAAFGESGALRDFANMHFQTLLSVGSRRLISGHLWFMPGEPLAEGWYYCTLLRDPVDRFLSQYWFNRAIAQQGAASVPAAAQNIDPQVRAAAAYGLEEYVEVEDRVIRRSFTNVQAVHFAQRLCVDPYVLPEDELLEAAIAAVDEYDCVGTFENCQGFVDAISRDLGLARVEIPRLNVTAKRKQESDLPEGVVRRLRQANTVDMALVEWARERFRGGKRQREGSVPRVARPAGGDFGTREIELLSARCAGEESGTTAVLSGEIVRIVMECNANAAVDELTIGIGVRDQHAQLIYGSNTRLLGLDMSPPAQGSFTRCLVLQANLGFGKYSVAVSLHRGASHMEGCYHWVLDAASFEVVGHRDVPFEGLVDLRGRRTRAARFDAFDSRVSTLVGDKTAQGRIVTTGKAGFLMFGPYVSMPAGDYRVTILGEVSRGEGELAHFDVACDAGRECVAERALRAEDARTPHGPLLVMRFVLPAAVRDLEVRATVPEGTDMSITGYEIEPWLESAPLRG